MLAFIWHPKTHEATIMELSGSRESSDNPQFERDMPITFLGVGFICKVKNQSSLVEKKMHGCGFTNVFLCRPH